MKSRIAFLFFLVLVLFVLNIFIGSVHIDAAEVVKVLIGSLSRFSVFGRVVEDGPIAYIVLGSRLPAAVTAALAGAGLATSGLLLQTAFHNPLAGPSILGISSGANLGVAIVMLALGGSITAGMYQWTGYQSAGLDGYGSLACQSLDSYK